jgi:recombination protein RecA
MRDRATSTLHLPIRPALTLERLFGIMALEDAVGKQARLHELEQTVTLLQHKWGQRAIRPVRQLTATRPPVLSTGLAPLDQALGIGGLPRGRVTELVTAGSSGQALLLASLIRQTQRGGEAVVYVDVDQSLDLDLLARRDIDLRRLYILRPHGFRHALEMTGDLLAEGGAALIVFDRLQPLLFEDASLALLDQALRAWTPLVHSTMSTLLVLTETICLDWYPEGLGLPYFASLRLACEGRRWRQRRRQVTGLLAEVRVLKNKLAPIGPAVELEIPLT